MPFCNNFGVFVRRTIMRVRVKLMRAFDVIRNPRCMTRGRDLNATSGFIPSSTGYTTAGRRASCRIRRRLR